MTMYWPLDHSKPRTVSEREMGPWTGQTVCMLIRLRQVSWSRLKERPPRDSVARYSLIGMVTSPNWIAPRHIERAMQHLLAGSSPNATRANVRATRADRVRAAGKSRCCGY